MTRRDPAFTSPHEPSLRFVVMIRCLNLIKPYSIGLNPHYRRRGKGPPVTTDGPFHKL
jgi:hypothetical protein